jgi:hypothetical protein
VSAEPPPPPQVSPDGKFYWDGTRWVPMTHSVTHSQAPAQIPPTYAPPKKGHALRNVSCGCLGLIALLIVVGIIGNAGSRDTPTSSSSATSQSSASPAPPSSKFVTFGSGTWVVGKDIQAGTYRTRHGSSGCYFARLKGFSGALSDIIANENTNAPAVVTISPTDQGFQSSRCDKWSSDLSAITTSNTSFGDGDFMVGTDMLPGTYRNTASTRCYWARLRGFGHTIGDIVANDNTDAQAVVTIAASDSGFESSRCGTWTKM